MGGDGLLLFGSCRWTIRACGGTSVAEYSVSATGVSRIGWSLRVTAGGAGDC